MDHAKESRNVASKSLDSGTKAPTTNVEESAPHGTAFQVKTIEINRSLKACGTFHRVIGPLAAVFIDILTGALLH